MSFLTRQLAQPLPDVVGAYFGDGGGTLDRWPPARLRDYQHAALVAMTRHAFDGSAFYRDRWRRAGVDRDALATLPAGIERLPLVAKDDIRGRPWILLAVSRQRVAQIHVSTGTTGGEEIYVPHTWEDLHVRNVAPAMRRLVPVGIEDVVVNALPYEMSSAGLAFHRTFQKACGALVVPAGKGGYYSTPERGITLARDLGATILITTPSYAVSLAEAADALGIDLHELDLRFLWLTGEGCASAFRARVERRWGCPAYFFYGSLEAGPIGIECRAQTGYHVAAGHVYLEIVDAVTGGPVEVGNVGEIVVTELTRQASPLIRYRTGDLGFVDDRPCPCGMTLPRLHLRGREGDQLSVAGISCSPFLVEEFLMRISEVGDWYELVPSADGVLRVRVEPAAGVTPSQALRASIESRLEYESGIPIQVELTGIARPRGKVARVVRDATCRI